MKSTWIIVGLLVFLIAAPVPSFSQDEAADDVEDEDEVEDEEEEEEEDDDDEVDLDDDGAEYDFGEAGEQQQPGLFPPSHPQVQTSYMFLDNVGADNRFYSGAKAELLVGFANTGASPLSVTHVHGGIHSTFDYTYMIQNFSYTMPNIVVAGGQQATFRFAFTPDVNLEPRDYTLSIHTYYNDETQRFSNAFVNKTIDVAETAFAVQSRTYTVYGIGAAVAVLALVVLSKTFGRKRGGRRSAPRASASSVNADGVDEDWLPKEALRGSRTSPRRAGRK